MTALNKNRCTLNSDFDTSEDKTIPDFVFEDTLRQDLETNTDLFLLHVYLHLLFQQYLQFILIIYPIIM